MVFSKSFPRRIKGQSYPQWEEVFLTEKEEEQEEKKAHEKNIDLMKQCIDDARTLFSDRRLKDYQSDIVKTAVALYEKRASHVVYWKERKAKDKFHNLYGTKN